MKENTHVQTKVNCTHMDCKNKLVLFSFTCTFIFTVPKLQHTHNPEPCLKQTHFCLESKDGKSKAHTLLKKNNYQVKALISTQNNCTVFIDIIFYICLPLTLNPYNHHLNK